MLSISDMTHATDATLHPFGQFLWRNIFFQAHSSEKSYKCNQCEFASHQKGDLKNHILIHSGLKPIACNLCEYKTTTRSSLGTHMKSHYPDERTHQCTYCDYTSTTRETLKSHMKRHIGGTQYKCKHCDFTTLYSNSLSSNVKTHTKEKHIRYASMIIF